MTPKFKLYVALTATVFISIALLLGPYFTPFFIGILLILAAMDGKL